jgi:putative holliday junction resolvase
VGDGAAPPVGDGVRIGVDVGTVRVGVAASDPGGVLAFPVSTLARDRKGGADLDALAALVAEREAVEVVVGLPRHLSGREGASVALARNYAGELAARIVPVPVVLVDERLTTVSAQRDLRSSGRRGRATREVVDQAAAVALLQSHLDGARSATGESRAPSGTVEP